MPVLLVYLEVTPSYAIVFSLSYSPQIIASINKRKTAYEAHVLWCSSETQVGQLPCVMDALTIKLPTGAAKVALESVCRSSPLSEPKEGTVNHQCILSMLKVTTRTHMARLA